MSRSSDTAITYSNMLSVENYCLLRKSVKWHDIPEKYVKLAFDRSDYIIAAYDGETPVGMARLMADGTQAYIMDVAVRPEYQGNGIGKGLMERIVAFIKGMDYDTMLANLMTSKKTTGFYEKSGFRTAQGMMQWFDRKE